MKSERYTLEKAVWTELDFEFMGWHDATVYALGSSPQHFEFLLDIDYILRWVSPSAGEKYYHFWISPATLVFENVGGVHCEVESQHGELTLQGIERTEKIIDPNLQISNWVWSLQGNEGRISFRATGYKQYFRMKPLLRRLPYLDFGERGGISFGRKLNE